LTVVDVTHDGDDRRTRLELLGRVGNRRRRVEICGVLLLLHRLESEFTSNQLDLVEVETLVDGDHQAEVLERETDDLNGRSLENLSQLVDGDEFVDSYRLLFALGFRLSLSRKLL